MSWFKNLKIKTKLILSFGSIIVLVLVLSVFAISNMKSLDRIYSHALDYPERRLDAINDFNRAFINLRRVVATMSTYSSTSDDAKVTSLNNEANQYYLSGAAAIGEYDELVKADPDLSQADISDRLAKTAELLGYYKNYKENVSDPVAQLALASLHDESLEVITQGLAMTEEMTSLSDALLESATALSQEASDGATEYANSAITLVVIMVVVVVVLAFILALAIATLISNPIKQLVDVADNVARGNLNVNIDTSLRDETGTLAKSFSSVIQNVNTIITDINTMHTRHEDGEMSFHIDSSRYQGAYSDVATGVNDITNSYVDMINDIFMVLKEYGVGSFSAHLKTYKGEKAVANEQMSVFRETISQIVNEINKVAKAGAEGRLSVRADLEQYKGDWQNIMLGLNNVLDAVIAPINETQSVLLDMSRGNFDSTVNGNYQGDFAEIKKAMNNTVGSIAAYIKEITDILGKVANGDLRVSIHREYIGQFNYIKESINTIVSTLHKTMTEILSASDQVLSGAKQISSSAMTLAEGASEQASAIEELTASVETINNQTQKNAENADAANDLSNRSTLNAQNGNEEMQHMLTAMSSIKESSNNISKVIRAISDIAFQTNLLALNAAVEAARAGEHGKGFAVVAEEVRSLASRSQTSANDTTALIEDSNTRVTDGERIAQGTAAALNTIVENASQVSSIITTIAEASKNQADAISQVSIGLSQISQVVQNNSSTSEESAAAAQELNSQAELLQQMVAFFKI